MLIYVRKCICLNLYIMTHFINCVIKSLLYKPSECFIVINSQFEMAAFRVR